MSLQISGKKSYLYAKRKKKMAPLLKIKSSQMMKVDWVITSNPEKASSSKLNLGFWSYNLLAKNKIKLKILFKRNKNHVIKSNKKYMNVSYPSHLVGILVCLKYILYKKWNLKKLYI